MAAVKTFFKHFQGSNWGDSNKIEECLKAINFDGYPNGWDYHNFGWLAKNKPLAIAFKHWIKEVKDELTNPY